MWESSLNCFIIFIIVLLNCINLDLPSLSELKIISPEFQISTGQEPQPCRLSSCNGFKVVDRCETGRCECPEERQFCTNYAKATHTKIIDTRKNKTTEIGYYLNDVFYKVENQRDKPEEEFPEGAKGLDRIPEQLEFFKEILQQFCSIMIKLVLFLLPILLCVTAPHRRVVYGLFVCSYYFDHVMSFYVLDLAVLYHDIFKLSVGLLVCYAMGNDAVAIRRLRREFQLRQQRLIPQEVAAQFQMREHPLRPHDLQHPNDLYPIWRPRGRGARRRGRRG